MWRAAAFVVIALAAAPAHATCAAYADPSYVEDFVSQPSNLLRQSPRGGATLVSQVRVLAVNGSAALKAIGIVLAQANPQQKEAIGTGLARAGGACVARSPDIARRINDLVRSSGDRDVIRAYAQFLNTNDPRPIGGDAITTGSGNSNSTNRKGNPLGRIGPRDLPMGDPFAKH